MKNFKLTIIAVAAFFAVSYAGFGQNEELQNSGTIINSPNGKIIMGCDATENTTIENSGTINNAGTITLNGDAPVFNNDGTFANEYDFDGSTDIQADEEGLLEFVGALSTDRATALTGANALASNDVNRVAGYVLYNSGSAQDILDGFYHNVYLGGTGGKNYTTVVVNVSGEYNILDGTEAIKGQTPNASGNRDYGTSTFRYDGNDGLTAQVIAPEPENGATGGTGYYNLTLRNASPKTINGTVLVDGDSFSQEDTDGGLTVAAGGLLTLETATGTFSDQTTIDATGAITVAADAGNTTFDGTSSLVNNGDFNFKGDGTDALAFDATAVTIGDGATMDLDGAVGTVVTFNAPTTIAVDGGSGGGTLTQNTGTVSITNAITANGTINLFASGDGSTNGGTTVSGADGSIDVGANGSFALGDGATADLYITSANGFTNAGDGTNMDFDVASTTHYSGAGTTILATVRTSDENAYGNLVINNGGAPIAVDGAYDINVAGNFSLDGANLDMATNSGELYMMDGTATVTFDELEEVRGKMTREIDGNDALMTFNNSGTTLDLTANEGSLTSLSFTNTPGDIAYDDYTAATDVQRSIGVEYTESASDWVATIKYGYLYDEVPAALKGAGDEQEGSLRYRETLGGGASEKVSTGVANSRTVVNAVDGTSFGTVELAGVTPDGSGAYDLSQVTGGNSLFLRGGPATFISIVSGRWSNPDTWDEGEEPGSSDIVEIRHTVHAGFERSIDANFPDDEATPDKLASKITVIAPVAGTYDNPSLLLADDDVAGFTNWGLWSEADDGPVAGLTSEEIGTLTVLGNADTGDSNVDVTNLDTGNTLYDTGLVLFESITNKLIINNTLTNSAEIHNGGTIQICE